MITNQPLCLLQTADMEKIKKVSNSSNPVTIYCDLQAKLGDCPGFIATQKNSAQPEEIVVVADTTYTVFIGNIEFISMDCLDNAIIVALALHIVFKQPFAENCQRLAGFMQLITKNKFVEKPGKMTNIVYNNLF